jgi:hypothetical protein
MNSRRSDETALSRVEWESLVNLAKAFRGEFLSTDAERGGFDWRNAEILDQSARLRGRSVRGA